MPVKQTISIADAKRALNGKSHNNGGNGSHGLSKHHASQGSAKSHSSGPAGHIKAEDLSYTKCDTCYWLTAQDLDDLEIVRLNENYEGYQRPLKAHKVTDIVEDLKNPDAMPYSPVYAAIVNGTPYIVDGQHRKFAHVAAGKRLPVFFINMTEKQARETFCRDNNKVTRLSTEHTSKVSNSQKTVFMKAIKDSYEIEWAQIQVLMDNICGRLGSFEEGADFTSAEKIGAETFLEIWVNKSKNRGLWKPVDKAPNVRTVGGKKQPMNSDDAYSSKAVIGGCGRLIREFLDDPPKYKKRLALIANSDFKNSSSASFRKLATNTGRTGAKMMLEFMKSKVLANALD